MILRTMNTIGENDKRNKKQTLDKLGGLDTLPYDRTLEGLTKK